MATGKFFACFADKSIIYLLFNFFLNWDVYFIT